MNKTILIVTGMSGAGKTQVVNTLQDNGFFCIDNLPIPLFNKLIEILDSPNDEIGRFVALCLDLREGNLDEKFPEIFNLLKKSTLTTKIIFVDASDEVLLRRFIETRRPHPLSLKGSISEGIKLERKRMAFIKDSSDFIIDTTNYNIHQLREEVLKVLEQLYLESKMVVNIVSFGFSRGIPLDSSLLFDVRFLPNPYFIEELKELNGKDERVKNFIFSSEEGKECLNKIKDFIFYILPKYQKEGKHYATISIGCTGGKHRSVAIAEELFKSIKEAFSYEINLIHRELKE